MKKEAKKEAEGKKNESESKKEKSKNRKKNPKSKTLALNDRASILELQLSKVPPEQLQKGGEKKTGN